MGNTVLFREHRGTLDDALETVRSVDSLATLVAFADQIGIPKASGMKIEPYGYDERINWDTHIVTIPGYGVFGFTNGPLPAL